MELGNYIHDYLARAAADPQDDLLDALAIACNASGFDQITTQIMMVILFGACGESTGSLLGNSMWILATRPDLSTTSARHSRPAHALHRGGVAV
jgi:cytochrome P450 family 144